MLEILRKFFDFCDKDDRRKFYTSIFLGVLAALFTALRCCHMGSHVGHRRNLLHRCYDAGCVPI